MPKYLLIWLFKRLPIPTYCPQISYMEPGVFKMKMLLASSFLNISSFNHDTYKSQNEYKSKPISIFDILFEASPFSKSVAVLDFSKFFPKWEYSWFASSVLCHLLDWFMSVTLFSKSFFPLSSLFLCLAIFVGANFKLIFFANVSAVE